MEAQQLAEVIAQAQAGHARAYETLLEAYGPRLYGYFFRTVGNHHDAEDLLGEMSIKLVGRLTTYDDRGKFDFWLFRIAANLVRDRIRRLRTNPAPASLSAEDESGGSMGDRVPGDSEPADKGLQSSDAAAALAKALGRLDETTRQMIVLRHYGEMSYREIADICDCPVGTVLARVHRGLKSLRKFMRAEDDPE